LVQELQIRPVQFTHDVRLEYVVVVGDELPEYVLFVQADETKPAIFQLRRGELMQRVSNVIVLSTVELLAAAKRARV
jgi:hypothetical protein|tara:strand:+ start:119 stop:349 length:231 start_codon:yes stop_codon:yes gene_type:complete